MITTENRQRARGLVRLSMLMDPELHQKLKIEAVLRGVSMREHVTSLILKGEQAAREQTER